MNIRFEWDRSDDTWWIPYLHRPTSYIGWDKGTLDNVTFTWKPSELHEMFRRLAWEIEQ